MKFLVVGSPHSASTRDVWIGVMKGLAANGQSVQSYDVFPRGEFYSNLVDFVQEHKIPLQWLREIPSPMLLAYEPVFMAAHAHEVDCVFFVSPQYLPLDIPRMLRKDGFKVWGYFTECPYEDHIDAHEKAACFDRCFLTDLYSESTWRMFNPASFYLPHSYDPDKHFPSWDVPEGRRERHEDINEHQHVVYVGSGFKRRQRYLEDVNWAGIDLRIYGHWPLMKKPTGADPKNEQRFEKVLPPQDSPLETYTRHVVVDNAFTARLYRGAAIGINIHRTERWNNDDSVVIDEGEAYSIGPRAVELAACGTFQTADYRPELVDVFGDSVPQHKTPEEMGRIIRKYLDDPVRRRELAMQQHEAIKGRTFAANVRRALEQAA